MAIAILIRGLDLVPALRHRLGAHPGRPGNDDRDDLDLHLCPGLQQFETSYTAAIAFLMIAILTVVVDLGAEAHGDRAVTTASSAAARDSALRYAAASSLRIVFLFPIYWLFMISFKTPDEIFAYPPVWWPAQLQFANYAVLFKDGDVITVWNTLVIAGDQHHPRDAARHDVRLRLARFSTGGENLAMWIISQRMMPPIAIVFPIFLLYVWLGWVDTYVGLILLYTAFNLPYVIWMMRGYIAGQCRSSSRRARGSTAARAGRCLRKVVFPMVARRPLRDRRLHLRVRLERVPLRARADQDRGHHLPGPGHPLFRRPVQFLGQDRRHFGARHGADLHRGDGAALPGARDLDGRGEGVGGWAAGALDGSSSPSWARWGTCTPAWPSRASFGPAATP